MGQEYLTFEKKEVLVLPENILEKLILGDEPIYIQKLQSCDPETLVRAFDDFSPIVFNLAKKTLNLQEQDADVLVGEVYQHLLKETADGKWKGQNILLYLIKTAFDIHSQAKK